MLLITVLIVGWLLWEFSSAIITIILVGIGILCGIALTSAVVDAALLSV